MMTDAPRRRRSDRTGVSRWLPSRRLFYEGSIFALLGVVVVLSLGANSRAETSAERSGRLVCALEDVSGALNETVELARQQAPVIEAARRLISAQTPEDEAEAIAVLRETAPEAPAEPPPGPVVVDVGDVRC